MAEFERLAYETAKAGLEHQERDLEALRSRTGVLLAASSLTASFLGEAAFRDPPLAPAAIALASFLVSIAASVYVLTPKTALVFALWGTSLYEELYEFRADLAEVHRRLTYELDRYRRANDLELRRLMRTYRWGAAALVAEILTLVALVSDTIL